MNLGESRSVVEEVSRRLKLNECISENILLDTGSLLGNKFFIMGVPTFIFLKEGVPVCRAYFVNESLIKEVLGNE